MHEGESGGGAPSRHSVACIARCIQEHILPKWTEMLVELERRAEAVKVRAEQLRGVEVNRRAEIVSRFQRIEEIIRGAQAALPVREEQSPPGSPVPNAPPEGPSQENEEEA